MVESEQKRIFDEWLDRHKGLFFKVVRAYAFTPQDQDDLFQEIAIQVWDSVPGFRGESSVATWIYRVALYTAMSWARQEIKHEDGKRPLTGIEHTLIATPTQKDGRLIWLYEQIAQLDEIDRSLTLLLVNVTLFLNGNGWMGLALTAVVLPLTYFGGRWEVQKFYMPKKRELEALRETLLQADEQSAA